MFQLYADRLVELIEFLRELEAAVPRWNPRETQQNVARVYEWTTQTESACRDLGFTSARKQATRVKERLALGGYSNPDFTRDIGELRTRFREDMQECIFFCESDASVITQFFQRAVDEKGKEFWRFKSADEIFDPTILWAFQGAAEDIDQACKSYVVGLYTACVFHLMRVVEVGLLHIAKLVGMNDPKPSWGVILQTLEKYALRTDYNSLPEFVKPLRDFIRGVIPRMQAIQHAWRNKVDHATLVPTQKFGKPEATEILTATQAFMRVLAGEFPPALSRRSESKPVG